MNNKNVKKLEPQLFAVIYLDNATTRLDPHEMVNNVVIPINSFSYNNDYWNFGASWNFNANIMSWLNEEKNAVSDGIVFDDSLDPDSDMFYAKFQGYISKFVNRSVSLVAYYPGEGMRDGTEYTIAQGIILNMNLSDSKESGFNVDVQVTSMVSLLGKATVPPGAKIPPGISINEYLKRNLNTYGFSYILYDDENGNTIDDSVASDYFNLVIQKQLNSPVNNLYKSIQSNGLLEFIENVMRKNGFHVSESIFAEEVGYNIKITRPVFGLVDENNIEYHIDLGDKNPVVREKIAELDKEFISTASSFSINTDWFNQPSVIILEGVTSPRKRKKTDANNPDGDARQDGQKQSTSTRRRSVVVVINKYISDMFDGAIKNSYQMKEMDDKTNISVIAELVKKRLALSNFNIKDEDIEFYPKITDIPYRLKPNVVVSGRMNFVSKKTPSKKNKEEKPAEKKPRHQEYEYEFKHEFGVAPIYNNIIHIKDDKCTTYEQLRYEAIRILEEEYLSSLIKIDVNVYGVGQGKLIGVANPDRFRPFVVNKLVRVYGLDDNPMKHMKYTDCWIKSVQMNGSKESGTTSTLGLTLYHAGGGSIEDRFTYKLWKQTNDGQYGNYRENTLEENLKEIEEKRIKEEKRRRAIERAASIKRNYRSENGLLKGRGFSLTIIPPKTR